MSCITPTSLSLLFAEKVKCKWFLFVINFVSNCTFKYKIILFYFFQDVLETLEEKRKAKAAVYYEHKKKIQVRQHLLSSFYLEYNVS